MLIFFVRHVQLKHIFIINLIKEFTMFFSQFMYKKIFFSIIDYDNTVWSYLYTLDKKIKDVTKSVRSIWKSSFGHSLSQEYRNVWSRPFGPISSHLKSGLGFRLFQPKKNLHRLEMRNWPFTVYDIQNLSWTTWNAWTSFGTKTSVGSYSICTIATLIQTTL